MYSHVLIFDMQVATEEVQDLFNVGSSQKEPLLSKLDHQTVLVGYDYKSVVFENSQGVPRKDFYLMWSNLPQFIGNYVFISVFNCSRKMCAVNVLKK